MSYSDALTQLRNVKAPLGDAALFDEIEREGLHWEQIMGRPPRAGDRLFMMQLFSAGSRSRAETVMDEVLSYKIHDLLALPEGVLCIPIEAIGAISDGLKVEFPLQPRCTPFVEARKPASRHFKGKGRATTGERGPPSCPTLQEITKATYLEQSLSTQWSIEKWTSHSDAIRMYGGFSGLMLRRQARRFTGNSLDAIQWRLARNSGGDDIISLTLRHPDALDDLLKAVRSVQKAVDPLWIGMFPDAASFPVSSSWGTRGMWQLKHCSGIDLLDDVDETLDHEMQEVTWSERVESRRPYRLKVHNLVIDFASCPSSTSRGSLVEGNDAVMGELQVVDLLTRIRPGALATLTLRGGYACHILPLHHLSPESMPISACWTGAVENLRELRLWNIEPKAIVRLLQQMTHLEILYMHNPWAGGPGGSNTSLWKAKGHDVEGEALNLVHLKELWMSADPAPNVVGDGGFQCGSWFINAITKRERGLDKFRYTPWARNNRKRHGSLRVGTSSKLPMISYDSDGDEKLEFSDDDDEDSNGDDMTGGSGKSAGYPFVDSDRGPYRLINGNGRRDYQHNRSFPLKAYFTASLAALAKRYCELLKLPQESNTSLFGDLGLMRFDPRNKDFEPVPWDLHILPDVAEPEQSLEHDGSNAPSTSRKGKGKKRKKGFGSGSGSGPVSGSSSGSTFEEPSAAVQGAINNLYISGAYRQKNVPGIINWKGKQDKQDPRAAKRALKGHGVAPQPVRGPASEVVAPSSTSGWDWHEPPTPLPNEAWGPTSAFVSHHPPPLHIPSSSSSSSSFPSSSSNSNPASRGWNQNRGRRRGGE